MVDAINVSLSGLAAAGKRFAVSANNIANQNSTKSTQGGKAVDKPFTPQRVDQVSLGTGGVTSVVRDVEPATIPQFNPASPDADENGTVDVPNVSLETELVNQKIATYDFKANLKAIKAHDELLQFLLDIKS